MDRNVSQVTFQASYCLTFHVSVYVKQNNRLGPVIALVVPLLERQHNEKRSDAQKYLVHV
jgi:hypothetical protein